MSLPFGRNALIAGGADFYYLPLWHGADASQVKALTREVGTLQEELKREVKRRQRAVERCKECERAVDLAEEHIKELRYSNKCRPARSPCAP